VKRRAKALRAWLGELWAEPAARVIAIVVVLVPALALILLALLLPAGDPPREQLVDTPVTVTNTVTPTTSLFGDPIEAEIAVLTDSAVIDARSVSVHTDFRPYDAGATRVDRSSREGLSLLRTSIQLQCLTAACLPGRGGRAFRFEPVVVSYRPVAGGGEQRVARAWAPVQVYSRLGAATPSGEALADNPPSLDTRFRISPTLLRVVLVTLALVLGLTGTLLIATGLWPRFPYSQRHWRRLSPLDQALAQLDAAAAIDDETLRRRVLEQLASRLDEADLDALAQESRTLAWDADPPEREALTLLGTQIRGSRNGGSRS
jgi:hypothetical protein